MLVMCTTDGASFWKTLIVAFSSPPRPGDGVTTRGSTLTWGGWARRCSITVKTSAPATRRSNSASRRVTADDSRTTMGG